MWIHLMDPDGVGYGVRHTNNRPEVIVNTGSLTVSVVAINAPTVFSGYVDSTGVQHGYIDNAGAPQICAQTYLQAVAEGDIAGHSLTEKIGYAPSITTTQSDIWSKGGNYTFPSTGLRMSVSSGSTSDNASSSGAIQVTVYYLDTSWISKTEIVNLNGIVAVTTVASDIYRINGFRVTSAGSTGVCAGALSLYSGATNYGWITAGFTRARNSCYTVPSGSSLYITSFSMGWGYKSNSTHYARIILRATQNEGIRTPGIFYPIAEVIVSNGTNHIDLQGPRKIAQKTDIKMSGISTFTEGEAITVMRGWLE